MNSSCDNPLRIGILGAARIARLFVEGVRASRLVSVTAVASRDVNRARAFAQDANVARVHSSYEDLLGDPEIEAIYIPLPNNLHATWSIRAAQAGKHVLCEKPLAATAAEARAVFEAAKKHGVYAVEAYPYRAQPQTLKMRELLAASAIGRLQLIQASFGFPLADSANIRMSPDLAGGALMDAGSYPISLVRTVAGAQANARSRGFTMGRIRSGSDHRRHARILQWPVGADFVHLRHGSASSCLHCRRCRFDQHNVLQRHFRGISAAPRGQARNGLGRTTRDHRDRIEQRLF